MRKLLPTRHEVTLLPAAAYDVRYKPKAPLIGFAFETQEGAHAFASDRMLPFRTRPNSTAYVPAGCEVASRSPHGGEYLTVSWAERSGFCRFPERCFNDHMDRQAITAAQTLRWMILSGCVDLLDAEQAIATLAGAVDRANGLLRDAKAERWMTGRRLRIVDDLIETGMSRDLPVGEIAAYLGLSSGFFNRAFKAAVGKTPHDYILDRRVARARRLIACTDMALARVASACGLASQAHMTTQMRRRLGVTPGMLRAQSSTARP